MAFSEGQKLDNNRYVIKKELGRGGFGITYLAKNKHQEEVVIKTMTDEVQRSPDFARSQQDFVNEALKLAKCDHPHVVQVEGVFQEGALWCIVMEYIAGENLASFIMNRGVLPEAEALLYVNQIGAALKVAHSKSLLHRDVTPNNIMLRTRRGGKPCTPEAVLIDFGLARKFIPNQLNSHTAFVTSGFAPIEQYSKRQTPGEYSDVYALAATLYVLLTKALPESAWDRAEEIRTGKSDPLVPPKRINPNISDKVNLAILKGMAFEAQNRPQSVRQWLALLEVENNKSLRNVDSEAPTIRIPGVSPFLEFFKKKAPKTPSPPAALSNDEAYACLERVFGLIILGKYQEAIVICDKALALKSNEPVYVLFAPMVWYARGDALLCLEKYQEAIASFDKALALKLDHHQAWHLRGNALHNLKKYQEAIASYDKALAIKPDHHQAWYYRGFELFILGKYQEAIASFDKALALKPDHYQAWHLRGAALFFLEKYQEAIASYDKALAIKPDYPQDWCYRGDALYNLKKYQEAIASYDKALAIKPDFDEVRNKRGNALSILKKYEEWIATCDQTLAINPNNHFFWYSKASCYALQSSIHLAIENLEQAIKLNPDCRKKAKTDSNFDLIRQDWRFKALIDS
jgi:tetratricopeptide (TPR) repeat protein/tRNA A-37 threonylcarbamoyl transferase component Bud32